MDNPKGKIIIEPEANVWPHEIKTAKAFTAIGHDVCFLAENKNAYRTSPDAIIFDALWEMKSPRSARTEKVLKVVREALHQAQSVIYDSQRVKNLTDTQIEKELRRISPMLPAMKNLIFINRKRQIIVIKQTQSFDINKPWRYHSQ